MKNLLIYFLGICWVFARTDRNKNSLHFEGIYVFSTSPLQDSIFIVNDSVYMHKYWASPNDQYEAEGKWIYDPKEEEVLFKNFVFFNDEGPASPAGNWYSRVRVSSEVQIDLMYSSESNIFFRKVSEEKVK